MLTPYAAAKIVNAELDKAGIKRIPPQMMYNYTTQKLNQGKRPLIKVEETEEGVSVNLVDLHRWIKSYIDKKLPKKEEQKFEEVTIVGDRSF